MGIANLFARGVHHLGFVVEDLDAAIARFKTDYGAESFNVYDFVPGKTRYKGQPVEGFRLRLAMMGVPEGSTFEIIQPMKDGPSIFRDFLNSGGLGYHHICVSVDNFDYWRARLDERNTQMLFETETEDDKIGFRRNMFFKDELMGAVLEIREIPYFRKK